MARITQLLIQAEHKPGTLANICSELANKAVNITAIMAAPDRPGGLRLVATPLAAAKKVPEALQLPIAKKTPSPRASPTAGRPGQGHAQTRRRRCQHLLCLWLDRERRATRAHRAGCFRRGEGRAEGMGE